MHGYAVGGGSYFALLADVVIAAEDAYFQMPLPQGLGAPGGETMIEPWVLMNFHRAYEYLYLSQTLSAQEALRMGMVNRVVALDELEETSEIVAHQIAQAPLSVLMGIKAGVKRVWEGMGMRVQLQNSLQMMQVVGRAGDVAKWREENAEKGYGSRPARLRPSGPRRRSRRCGRAAQHAPRGEPALVHGDQ